MATSANIINWKATMQWYQWIFVLAAIWYVQENKGEVIAGIYSIGILGYVGYLNISHRLNQIETQITDRKPIDIE